MSRSFRTLLSTIAVLGVLPLQSAFGAQVQVVPPGGTPAAPAAPALVFDSEAKEYNAKTGEETAPFTFYATNVTSTNVQINSLRTSCGCTVAQLPNQPYALGPGSN